MVINHLLNGMILQVPFVIPGQCLISDEQKKRRLDDGVFPDPKWSEHVVATG